MIEPARAELASWYDDLRSSVRHDLAKLKRELLVKLGRGNEAIEAVWAEYLAYPSTFTYGDLMKLAPREMRPVAREGHGGPVGGKRSFSRVASSSR